MDSSNLVELVTKEVMEVLSGKNREVTSSSQNSTGGMSPVPEVKPSFPPAEGGVISVLTGTDTRGQEVLCELLKMKDSFPSLAIYMTRAAQDVYNEIRFPSFSALKQAVRQLNFQDVPGIASSVSMVVVPALSLNTAAKVAHLMSDTPVTYLLVSAILENKNVVMATDSLVPQTARLNANISSEIETIKGRLRSYGVKLVTLNRMAEVAGYSAESCPMVRDRCQADMSECRACGQCVVDCPERVRSIVDAGASRVSALNVGGNVEPALSSMIDHTLLKPDASKEQIDRLCEEAIKYRFASVCVNPNWVRYCASKLKGTGVMVCTVIGFPLGATATSVKAFETLNAINDGADEIDMVINIGALKEGNLKLVEDDIKAVVNAAKGHTVKVILETSLLTDEEKVTACLLAKAAGAHFVKTSTGFGGGGATVKDVELMRKTVGPEMGVKASGGIRTKAQALELIKAGATRIGASASVAIIRGETEAGKGY